MLIVSLTQLSVCPFVMELRALSAFMLLSTFSSTALVISLPQHALPVFSVFFIISCTNLLRRVLSMVNEVCCSLFFSAFTNYMLCPVEFRYV